MAVDKASRKKVVSDKDVIHALIQMSALMNSETELFELLAAIHSRVSDVIEVSNIAIAAVDLDRKEMRLDYFVDEKDGTEYQNKTIKIEQGLSAYVIRTGKPTLLDEQGILDLQKQGEIDNIYGTMCASWIGVPITYDNETLGIIIVQSYSADVIYTTRDLEILTFVASNVGSLIKKRHIQDIERQSRRALQQSLQTITEQKAEIETTLSKLKEVQDELILKEKMASLGALVAGVAHEINTPLGVCVTGITTLEHQYQRFRKLLADGKATDKEFNHFMEDIADTCKIVQSNSVRAAELITSFKQIAVDQSSEAEREINLRSYLDEIVLSLNPLIKKTPHRITITCPDDIRLLTKPGTISQLFTNLITNSLIHGFEGVELGHMAIVVSVASDNCLKIEYQDDGVGMSQEQVTNFFEPFYTTKRGQGGSGLGGHIIYNIVASILKGTIKLTSKQGHGCAFVIKIPYMSIR